MILTEIDSRAEVKGSRDPLGLQPIWTFFGRQVVGNLTTVTTSVRSFTTLLLGLYYVDLPRDWGEELEESERLDRFLTFEQIVGYSRVAHPGFGDFEDIRGIRRVRQRLADEKRRVHVSATPSDQILSNQRSYGIWGLFASAATDSGWLANEPDPRLDEPGRELVKRHHLPLLTKAVGRDARQLLGLMKGGRFEPGGKHKALASALAKVHRAEMGVGERKDYEADLVACTAELGLKGTRGAPLASDQSRGRQRECWALMKDYYGARKGKGWGVPFQFSELRALRRRARLQGFPALAGHLEAIETLEPALAAMELAMAHLVGAAGRAAADVAAGLRKTWGSLGHVDVPGIRALRPGLVACAGVDGADQIVELAGSLRRGDWKGFIDLSIVRNAGLMDARGGAPWIEIRNGKVRANIELESSSLPPRSELPYLWEHSYFLNALKEVGATVVGGRL